jgi:hypothetical protein
MQKGKVHQHPQLVSARGGPHKNHQKQAQRKKQPPTQEQTQPKTPKPRLPPKLPDENPLWPPINQGREHLVPTPSGLKLLQENLFPASIIIKFFLCDRPGHTAIVNHTAPDALLNLSEMPLNTIVGHVVALDPNSPKNHSTK